MSILLLDKISYPLNDEGGYIYVADDVFSKLLRDILEQSGCKETIIELLKQRFRYLKEYGKKCREHRQWFKFVHDEYYCMRIKHRDLNLRIIFAITPTHGEERAILLYPFLEKNKSNSKTESYRKYMPKAEAVFKSLKEAKLI